MHITPQVRDVFPLDAALMLSDALGYSRRTMAQLLPAAASGLTLAMFERNNQS